MKKYILIFILLTSCIYGCSVIFPYEPHLTGINKRGGMELDAAKFSSLNKFYITMQTQDIEPIPASEEEVFLKIQPIAERLLALDGLCSKGFVFIKSSLKYFEGAKVSATIKCY